MSNAHTAFRFAVETIDYVFNALNIPVYYYLIAAGIGIVGCWKKEWASGIPAAYLFFVITDTVLKRELGVEPLDRLIKKRL